MRRKENKVRVAVITDERSIWLRPGAGDKLHTLLGIEEKDTNTNIQDMVAEE